MTSTATQSGLFFPSPNINHPIHRCLTPDFGFKNLSLFIFKRKPPKEIEPVQFMPSSVGFCNSPS